MTDTDAGRSGMEELAGKLTEAQRQALLGAFDNGHFLTCDFTDPWTVPAAEFLTLRTDRLTPLGLALRAHLQNQGNPSTGKGVDRG